MPTVAISGNDTVKINGRLLTDFADGDVGALTFPNEVMGVKTGKNGNSMFALNNTGRQADEVLRLIRGSPDDKFLQSILTQMLNNPTGFVLLTGELIKVIGDGAGNIINDTYILSSGVISKQVEAKSNAEGDTTQSVAEYHLKFANAPRVIA
jgi:hypothetical protein